MHRSFQRAIVTSVALLLPLSIARSQETPPSAIPAAPSLKVFLDCNSGYCDFDFFRTEISAVDWVRDRQVAGVHVLVTTQQTGAGGTEFTLAFLGLRDLAGIGDTLTFVSKPASVEDEVRKGLAQVLRAGLVPYVARTAGYDGMKISFGPSGTASSDTKPQNDRWNYWVFRTSVNGFSQGSSSNTSINAYGEFSASRVTEQWKTNISISNSYDESKFELSDGSTFTAIQRGYGLDVLEVKSLGPHWSAGLTGGVSSSTYSNQRRVFRIAPAIEYNIYPYKESTRRQLRIEYSVGMTRYDYESITIYDKLTETRPTQKLNANLSLRQPWGNVSVYATHRNFLDDMAKRSASVGGSVSWRIVKGLNFNIGGDFSQIRDQISLAKEDATDEEILVRERELATSYRYFTHFGISYTFGSIFNNIVNPRFGGGGCCD
jgi:hypothetical protein